MYLYELVTANYSKIALYFVANNMAGVEDLFYESKYWQYGIKEIKFIGNIEMIQKDISKSIEEIIGNKQWIRYKEEIHHLLYFQKEFFMDKGININEFFSEKTKKEILVENNEN